MSSTLRKNLHGLLALIATWVLLLIAGYALLQDLRAVPLYWGVVVIAPSVAILCFRWVLRQLPECAKPLRIIFWIGTVFGALLFALLAQGKYEQLSRGPAIGIAREEFILGLIAALLPCILLVWLFLSARKKEVSTNSRGWIRDLASAVIILALFGAGSLIVANQYAARIHADGFTCWDKIGRPIAPFEKLLKGREENDSLKALAAELRPYGVASLYKQDNPEEIPAAPGKQEFASKEVLDLHEQKLEAGDRISLPVEKYPNVAAASNGLQELYQSILSRPVPVWNARFDEEINVKGPNYLHLRKMAQTISADALLRLARGDQKGASEAVKAELHVVKTLPEHPTFVAFMIRIAIDAHLIKVIARLPAEEGAWEQLAQEVEQTRNSFKDLIQGGSWMWLHWADTLDSKRLQTFVKWEDSDPKPKLPLWFRTWVLARPQILLEAGRNSLFTAGMVDHWAHQDFLTTPADDRFESVLCDRYPSRFSPGLSRAWLRTNLLLLLKEQAELIRYCRAQMAAGQLASTASRASVVVPGAKWEISADSEKHSVALKLVPTPDWVANSRVTDKNFFLLPLDGSKSWEFVLP